MKHRRRIRSAIKWTGTVVTVLLLVMWLGTIWFACGMATSRAADIGVVCGQLRMGLGESSSSGLFAGARLVFYQNSLHQMEWWFRGSWYDSATGSRYVCIPLWFLVFLTGVPTFLMFRCDRRRARLERANACPDCGYSRTGLAAERPCPECGKSATATAGTITE